MGAGQDRVHADLHRGGGLLKKLCVLQRVICALFQRCPQLVCQGSGLVCQLAQHSLKLVHQLISRLLWCCCGSHLVVTDFISSACSDDRCRE